MRVVAVGRAGNIAIEDKRTSVRVYIHHVTSRPPREDGWYIKDTRYNSRDAAITAGKAMLAKIIEEARP